MGGACQEFGGKNEVIFFRGFYMSFDSLSACFITFSTTSSRSRRCQGYDGHGRMSAERKFVFGKELILRCGSQGCIDRWPTKGCFYAIFLRNLEILYLCKASPSRSS